MPVIHPFAQPEKNFTKLDNYLCDVVMPALRPNAWKVLCYIIRKTLGWNKEEDALSYSSIQKGTGIGSPSTLSAAISDLVDAGYILRDGSAGRVTMYALNRSYTVDHNPTDNDQPSTKTVEVKSSTTTETVEVGDQTTTETVEVKPKTTTETVDIKRNSIKDNKESAYPPTDIPLPESTNAATQPLTLPLVGIDVVEVKTDAPAKVDTPKPKDHPAVQKYRELSKRWPNNTQMQVITEAEIDDITLWEEAIKAWCGRGFSPVNINGMIDFYRNPAKFRTPYEQKAQHRAPAGIVNPARPMGVGFGKVEHKR